MAYIIGAEASRLAAARERGAPWRKWGPYLSERQWGTVREDYSANGDAWTHFTHDQARSRAYRWGEDGLAGFCDEEQRLCFAIGLWNGRDPILKERLFGLTNAEGNHGEDVKEYYFYLDATPTHSYMKWLYKYPQRAYPYFDLVATNRRRSRDESEYELIDTGIFADDRYFDVVVEYGKAAPEDLLVRIEITNRGPEASTLHVLPTLWFRNTWRYWPHTPMPSLRRLLSGADERVIVASHHELGERWLFVEPDAPLLFTDNETNNRRLFGTPNASEFVKDGINDYVVHQRREGVNAKAGTKSAADCAVTVAPGSTAVLRLRLSNRGPIGAFDRFADFDATFDARRREADEFYAAITPASASADAAAVMRQALAGMLWTKQRYFFDLEMWLAEHGIGASSVRGGGVRNDGWGHMVNADVISMPDKWEYPWYAAWDLAFQAVALSAVDLDFAKGQLELMLREGYLHPTGQMPAYEWNFGDVNPPVHAWATLFLYKVERTLGRADRHFLERSFQGLMLNFNWWVNRKDPAGRNVFAGGFLGLDNIGVFDRSAPLPTGGSLEQADGTAWMAFYCQCMLEMALILSEDDPMYEETAFKFAEHFMWISYAMDRLGEHHDEMWDEQDGFFYDLLRLPDGQAMRLKVRSMVGLLPLCASTVFEASVVERCPKLMEMIALFRKRHPTFVSHLAPTSEGFIGYKGRRLLSTLNKQKLERVLGYMLDENEFLGPHGIRSLSRYHLEHPFVFQVGGQEYKVQYLPGESDTGMFGGNSNWRGPVWMPVNALLIRALLNLYSFYGDEFKVQCPTGSGRFMTLFEVAQEISRRLASTFLRETSTGAGQSGRRPVYGGTAKFQDDPHWRDLILFYEYFQGDNGAGLGASHQTGWTGLIARLLDLFGRIDAKDLELEIGQVSAQLVRAQVHGERRRAS
jgi:hypothetical protein